MSPRRCRAYHPIIIGVRTMQAVIARCAARGGDRALAGARLRPDRGFGNRLLPARVRQHRARSRRRLVVVVRSRRLHARDGEMAMLASASTPAAPRPGPDHAVHPDASSTRRSARSRSGSLGPDALLRGSKRQLNNWLYARMDEPARARADTSRRWRAAATSSRAHGVCTEAAARFGGA